VSELGLLLFARTARIQENLPMQAICLILCDSFSALSSLLSLRNCDRAAMIRRFSAKVMIRGNFLIRESNNA
jgi:hypothetical protein